MSRQRCVAAPSLTVDGYEFKFDVLRAAWREVLTISERQALCVLGFVPEPCAHQRWDAIPADDRARLILAFRRGIDLGQACAEAIIEEHARQMEKLK